jgi:SAM-dependent methyltransferase
LENVAVGLAPSIVEAIVREHSYKPVCGNALLIGRQTVYLSPQEYTDLVRLHGIHPSEECLNRVTIDHQTLDRNPIFATKETITDRSVFHLLGTESVRALDHSDYEGAEVLHDLNKPLPKELESIADFIVDGSTLDNVFNPALALQNLNRLLRPGGRLLLVNMLSNHYEPYTIPNVYWYLDYFVANGFSDCKVYILVHCPPSPNVFSVDVCRLFDRNFVPVNFASAHVAACVVLAEKGQDSTTNAWPTQGHYRSEADWEIYRQRLEPISSSPRPHILNSKVDLSYFGAPQGYLFVGHDYAGRDPAVEQARIEVAKRKAMGMPRRVVKGGLRRLVSIAAALHARV